MRRAQLIFFILEIILKIRSKLMKSFCFKLILDFYFVSVFLMFNSINQLNYSNLIMLISKIIQNKLNLSKIINYQVYNYN
jgi:hypothetical protein